jgi:hypothetical protein
MRILIGALGTIAHKISLTTLCDSLNAAQSAFFFRPNDPAKINSEGHTKEGNSLYYFPDDLFSETHQISLNRNQEKYIRFWITDNEVFENLFSCTDQSNSVAIISLRSHHLKSILDATHKSFLDYVELEIAAQLLCLIYRRSIGISAAPTACVAPWHIDRRNDLFDYHGLHPENVQKLMEPSLDPISMASFREANVPMSQIEACLSIAQSASKYSLQEKFIRAFHNDPWFSLCGGAVLGFCASVFSTWSVKWWLGFVLFMLAILSWRVLRAK